MFYNAIIRDRENIRSPSRGVVGRLFLKNLKQVPSSWRIRFRGTTLERNANLDELMCNPEEPIQIYKPAPEGTGSTAIHVKTVTGNPLLFVADLNDTVLTLKKKIEEKDGTPIHKQRLIFRGQQLEDFLTLMEYNLKDSTLHLVLRIDGSEAAPPEPSSSAKGKKRTVRAIPTVAWNEYTIGLNIGGNCPNKKCVSNISNTTTPKVSEVIVNAKYGVVRMSAEKNKFKCPGCEVPSPKKRSKGKKGSKKLGSEESNLFTPKSFFVSYGRSLIRFKKAGLRQPVKTVFMESLGSLDETETFGESEDEAELEYDFIEITTVGKNSSPFFCVKCDVRCEAIHNSSRFSEVTLDCGHFYHRKCVPTGAEGCFVCETKILDSTKDLSWAEEEEEDEETDRKTKGKRKNTGNENDELGSLEIWDDEFFRNLQSSY